MTNFVISQNQTAKINITDDADNWTFNAGVSVEVDGDTAIAFANTANNINMEIRGAIENTGNKAAIQVLSAGLVLDLTASSTVKSQATAISLVGNDNAVDNTGSIHGKIGLASAGADNSLTNSGDILATSHAVSSTGESFALINEGTLKSGGATIVTGQAAHEMFTLDNHGTIIATNSSIAILGGDGYDVINNLGGTIKGDVLLGKGDDNFFMQSGTIDGVVRGGKGNDFYLMDEKTDIKEASHQGSDIVVSSISWRLGANFEELNLSVYTTANLNGTGNKLDNEMLGNNGNNHLKGMAGDDIMGGLDGNDILTGGTGADTFVFNAVNGADRITDFDAKGADHDRIDVSDFFASFEKLSAWMNAENGDVVIAIEGHGQMTLEDIKLGQLTAKDFIFADF